MDTRDRSNTDKSFNLARFINAQEEVYDRVLAELNDGQKRSHWMWYIFPQYRGLGRSPTARYYAIESREEALAYLNHPLLGSRLRECANLLLAIEGKTANDIFGYPDNLKLKSCLTLFSQVASDSLFSDVLNKYFSGDLDRLTLQLLEE